jgi:hypothetical protein
MPRIFKRAKKPKRRSSAAHVRAWRARKRAQNFVEINVSIPVALAAQLREYAELRGETLSAATAKLLSDALGPRE